MAVRVVLIINVQTVRMENTLIAMEDAQRVLKVAHLVSVQRIKIVMLVQEVTTS